MTRGCGQARSVTVLPGGSPAAASVLLALSGLLVVIGMIDTRNGTGAAVDATGIVVAAVSPWRRSVRP